MLNVLLTGTLVAHPKQRQASNGNAFATAMVRAPVEDADALFVSVITFSESAVAALMALTKGDAIAVTGRAKLKTWDRDGEQKHGMDVGAEQVLTGYQADKRLRQGRTEQDHARSARAG